MTAQAAAEGAALRIGTFDNSYARLPDRFHAEADAEPAEAPRLIRFNPALAEEIGLSVDGLSDDDLAALFSGNRLVQGAKPRALAYAGHQFGNFVPQLGDGRALLLGEIIAADGTRRDIQLKGSGRTRFSRGGDGRAAIGPVLREYIVAEAMAALGVPTTRALAAVTTGNPVFRETRLPGAVLTRVAASHIRVGTFQFFAARQDIEGLRLLTEHAIARHHPDAARDANPVAAFYDGVVAAQARLIAAWMQVGFIHGVMNTDNMAISGETIDYGPCAFMDEYDPAKVFSSIDLHGRYAFSNQPHIAQWNLARLAECLLPLLADDRDAAIATVQPLLDSFMPRFEQALVAGFRRKLGMRVARDEDPALIKGLLEVMAAAGADFTLVFRALGVDAELRPDKLDQSVTRRLFADPAGFDGWLDLWLQRIDAEGGDAAARREIMDAANPKYIPRNHRVEEVITAAVERDDLGPFETLLAVTSKPFDDQPGMDRFALPPAPGERVTQTFCGT